MAEVIPIEEGGIWQIREVPIDQLKIDKSYQREQKQEHVLSLARDFDLLLAGMIYVAERPNKDLYVVDGGHRVSAARIQQYKTLRVAVAPFNSVAEEARTFVVMNKDRNRVTGVQEYKAAVSGNIWPYTEIERRLRDSGIFMVGSGPRQGFYCIQFVSALVKHFLIDEEATMKALHFLAEAQPGEPITGKPFRGVWWLFHNGVDIAQYATALRSVPLTSFVRTKMLTEGGSWPDKQVARLFVALLNGDHPRYLRGKRSRKISTKVFKSQD